MRHVRIERPFTGGMVTDLPAYAIGLTNSSLAEDGYSPSGVFKQRGAWAFDGSVADVADNLVTIWRTKFALADVTRTITGDDDGDLFIHNPAGAGTALFTGTVPYLARAVYRDEVIFCAQDGETPLRRYSGAASVPSISDDDGSHAVGEATVTALTFGAAPDVGSYLTGDLFSTGMRIVEATTSSVTLDGFTSSASFSVANIVVSLTGKMFPGVSVYNAGTVTVATNDVTGAGTKFVNSAAVTTEDYVVISHADDGTVEFARIEDASPSDTVLDNGTFSWTNNANPAPYHILRACPFKDVASHKNSLWGTGVAQYPNRVYFSPPGWNPSFAPGFWEEGGTTNGGAGALSGIAATTGITFDDFLLSYVDVPTPYDGDANVAILPSPNQLWVLKRDKAYGIYGSWGGVDVSRDPIGPGCLDIRSAISVAEGAFWASDDDVYWAPGEQAIPLMRGKIGREWRALTAQFTPQTDADFITCGVTQGHLIVYISTAVGTITRCFICELNGQNPAASTWQSRLNNVKPRAQFTSRIPGEAEKLLTVTNDFQGRVVDLAPMVNGQGTADDDSGSFPRMKAYSPKITLEGVEGVTRLVDLDVHANLYDLFTPGLSSVQVAVVSEGGIGNPAASTKTLTDIDSDTTDDVNRHHRRVARDGRLHQVQLTADATGTDLASTKAEIHQIDMFMREGRSRSR